MRKIQKIYLCIAFIIFAVVVAILAVSAIHLVIEEQKAATTLDPDLYKHVRGLTLFWGIGFLLAPIFFLALSLIKNGYTLLAKDKSKSRIVFSILSSVLAIATMIMLLVAFVAPNIINENTGCNDVVLLSTWPAVILSFILGCIDIGKKDSYQY